MLSAIEYFMILKDKVVFITGGSAGIGLCCAKAYAREGAKVCIFALDEAEVRAAVAGLGEEHLGITGDLTNGDAVKDAITQTMKKYGQIDIIHNNAGVAHPSRPVHLTTEGEWDLLMNVNVKGIYYTTLHGIEALKARSGVIINTSSLVAEIGQERHAAYAASKGAVNALTKSMALDYASSGIRVNAVSPAGVWTPMLKSWCRDQPDSDTIEQYLNDIHLLGYCPEGDVVAEACVFLASEKAVFITGCILPVSGGAELGYRRSSGQAT